MNESKSGCCSKHIKGITCDVQHCEYHGEDNCCMAQHISVGPTSATSSSETACVTFRPKESF